ncbi:MAG: hypothetical protein WCL23_01655 [Candidatus Moraniibacteriota bacterium]
MDIKMTIPDAQSIFGKKFYADDQTEQVFGFRPKDDPLPGYWTSKDYELHAEAGHMLICYPVRFCYPNRLQNTPITLEKMATWYSSVVSSLPAGLLWGDQFEESGNYEERAWMKNDLLVSSTVLRSGWQFVSPEEVAGTARENFISQTDVLIGNMESLLSGRLPRALQTAISKWEGYERKVAYQLLEQGNNAATTLFLTVLDIVRLLREPVQNTFFRYLIVHGCTGEKLFRDFYSWSSSPSTDGSLVCFGDAGALGACVFGVTPVGSFSVLRAVASRSGF